MSDAEQERLVWMIARGDNTYRRLHQEFPSVPEYTWRLSGKGAYSRTDVVICHRKYEGELHDDETFELTDRGKNIVYRMEKEHKQEILAIVATVSAIIAAICSLAGLLLG